MPVDSVTLPKTVVPQLLDLSKGPEVTAPDSVSPDGDDQTSDETATQEVRPTGDLSTMVAQLKSSEPGTHELDCLATGIYFEAKSEPLAGQLAVGKVIANRAQSGGRFPSTYCGVLFQRGQFSFVHGHALPSVPRTSNQWQTAVAIAKIVDRDLKES